MSDKTYMEQRFNQMKRHSILKGSSAGMVLRIILLILFLIFSKMFFDWAVEHSHNHFTDDELQNYYQEKHVIIFHMKKKGIITEEQFQQMKDSIKINIKRDFIRERR